MEALGDYRNYWYCISPTGIQRSRHTWSERLKALSRDLAIVRCIVFSDLKARTFDKSFGWCWLLIEPLVMASLYWFITAVLFSVSDDGKQHFLYIMTAVIFFRLTSRIIDKSPTMITSYASVIRQTVFSVHLLLFVFILEEFVQFLLSLLVLLAFLACFGVFPGWTILLLPLVVLPQLIMTACFASAFAVVGTFFKDLSGLLYVFTSIWWYLSPGIYTSELVQARAPQLLWAFELNPFFFFLSAYRAILLDGQVPNLMPMLWITLAFSLPFWAALKLFFYARYYYFKFL